MKEFFFCNTLPLKGGRKKTSHSSNLGKIWEIEFHGLFTLNISYIYQSKVKGCPWREREKIIFTTFNKIMSATHSHLFGNLVECLGLISKYIGSVPLSASALWGSHVPHVAAHVALRSPEAATPAYILCLLWYIWNIGAPLRIQLKNSAWTASLRCLRGLLRSKLATTAVYPIAKIHESLWGIDLVFKIEWMPKNIVINNIVKTALSIFV